MLVHFDVVNELLLSHLEQVLLFILLFIHQVLLLLLDARCVILLVVRPHFKMFLIALLHSDLFILLQQHGCMFLPLSLAEELGWFIGLLILKRRSLIITLPPGELLIELRLNLRLFLFESLHYHLSRCKWILSVRSSKLFPVGFFLSLSSHLLGGRIRTLILTHAFQFFSSLSFCFSL